MKTFLTIIIILFLLSLNVYSQGGDTVDSRFRSWIYLTDSNTVLAGVIKNTGDSAINFLTSQRDIKSGRKNDFEQQLIPVERMYKIQVRRKGNEAFGALIGGAAGIALGAALGKVSTAGKSKGSTQGFNFDKFDSQLNTIGGAIVGGLAGSLLGVIIASAKIEFPIRGNQNYYKNQRDQIRKYSIMEK